MITNRGLKIRGSGIRWVVVGLDGYPYPASVSHLKRDAEQFRMNLLYDDGNVGVVIKSDRETINTALIFGRRMAKDRGIT